MKVFLLALAMCLAMAMPASVRAQYPPANPSPTSQTPPAQRVTPPAGATRSPAPDFKPPGEREPLVGVLAVVAILLAGGAGIFVYRVIRKGL